MNKKEFLDKFTYVMGMLTSLGIISVKIIVDEGKFLKAFSTIIEGMNWSDDE